MAFFDKYLGLKTYFTFSLILFAFFARGQGECSVSGKAVDSQSGEVLKGATVLLDNSKTGVVTDSLGRFTVHLNCTDAEHNITVSYLGYISYHMRTKVTDSLQLEVKMDNKSSQLQEVIVTSQGNRRNTQSPSLGVNLLSLKAVEKLPPAAGEVDILRSLQMLPGVSSVGEGANGINVRGGSVDQNLILIDNMPIFNPTHLLGLFSLFPTDAIREMEIYKGSIPAKYGGRASSVLDVKMVEPSTDEWKFKGGIGMISERATIEGPLIKDKLSLLVSTRASYNEYLVKLYNSLFVVPGADTPLPNNHATFYDAAIKLLYKPTEKDNITFSSYIGHDQYTVDSLFSIQGILENQAVIQYGHLSFALRWNHYFNPNLNFNLLGVSSRYSTSTTVTDSTAGLDLTTAFLYRQVKAELTYIPVPKHRLNMGVSIVMNDIQPGTLTPAAQSVITPVTLQAQHSMENALYVSDEYEISKKLLFEGGLRFVEYLNFGPYAEPIYASGEPKELYSITDTAQIKSGAVESSYGRVEPRLALRYKIDEKNSVKLGYNRMNQFIQILSNNTTPLPNARWQTSNRYIPPQESDLYTLGFFHDSRESFWEYSIETYYRAQRHLIDYTNGADLTINPAVETQLLSGEGRAYGVEFLLSKKKGVMTGWMSYTYARSLEKITGDFPAIQQLNGGNWFPSSVDKPHSLNIAMNFQTERHNILSLTFVYNTGRPFTSPVSFYQVGREFVPVFTDRNNDRISDYHRLDFSWTIKPTMKQSKWESSWVFAVYNLYGHKNAYSYFFKPNGYGINTYELSVFPSPIASLTYNVTFK